MGKFGVSDSTEAALKARMRRCGVRESDLDERFVRSRGPGGQHVNKTSTCVQLSHAPSGIRVRSERTRSQALNRYYARTQLLNRLEAQVLGRRSAEQHHREKIRRQKRRRSRRSKEKMLEQKKRRGAVKSLRRPPTLDE